MSASTQPTIGVVGVPEVARALAEIGLNVITGVNFRAAASAIIQQLGTAQFPIVVETLNEVAFDRWVGTAHQRSGGKVILLPTDSSVDLSNEFLTGVPTLPLPATVNDLLVRLGGAPALSPAGQTVINPQGTPVAQAVAPAPAPAPAPAFPDVFQTPAPAPAQSPAPVLPDVPTPAPAAPLVTDPFEQAAPAPAVTDPFAAAASSFPDPFAQAPAHARQVTDPFAQAAQAPVFPDAGQVATPPAFPSAPQTWTGEPAMPPRAQVQDQPAATPPQAWTPEPAVAPAWGQVQQDAWPTPQPQAAPALTPDLFSASTRTCQVLISVAAKGGVGKTTQTLMYAQTAGSAGLRVLVIDGNRDQGDISSSLRVEKTGLPTILHAINSSPEAAIVTKEQLNEVRPAGKQQLTFDAVFAPHREFAGPNYASAEVYGRVLSYAKTRYDLIVLDSQIIEAQKSDLFEGFFIPELRAGAWSAGIALYNYAAVRNAFAAFDELGKLGVSRDRALVVASRWPADDADPSKFTEKFGQYGTFVGFLADDPTINKHMSSGNILTGSPAVAAVNKAVLFHVTGNAAFAPAAPAATGKKGKPAPKQKRGLFGGRR